MPTPAAVEVDDANEASELRRDDDTDCAGDEDADAVDGGRALPTGGDVDRAMLAGGRLPSPWHMTSRTDDCKWGGSPVVGVRCPRGVTGLCGDSPCTMLVGEAGPDCTTSCVGVRGKPAEAALLPGLIAISCRLIAPR